MKKWKNWWYYHKSYVLVAVMIGLAAGRFFYNKITQVLPDLCVAIVSDEIIPSEAVSQLKDLLEARCEDFNGDGRVTVQIRAYGNPNADALGVEASAYQTATEAELIGDISACESYLFVTDDPVRLQRSYQILACQDGSCPNANDYAVEEKTYPLPALFDGPDTIHNEFLLTCRIGRRCFYHEKKCANAEECAKFWDLLTKNRTSFL